MSIFDTSYLTIITYPRQSGGKFLINALGLSDDAVFQDSQLAARQIEGILSQEDKFNILLEKISDTRIWNDLELGCQQLYGFFSQRYLTGTVTESMLHPVIRELDASKKRFFLASHRADMLYSELRVWSSPSMIFFYNSESFIKHRFLNAEWDLVCSSQVYYDPYYEQYTESIAEIQSDINDACSRLRGIPWNTEWYYDEDTTLLEIQKIYSILGLGSFNEGIIREYYRLWMKKIMPL